MTDNNDNIARAMMAAWARVKRAQSRMWDEWMIIGEGLLVGRRWAMQQAGTNKPEGKGYVLCFSEFLKRYKVADMDKSDRAKLLQLMEERLAVEEWRATLSDYERRNCNSPAVVLRKWKAATRVNKRKPRAGNVSSREYARATARIDELEEERGFMVEQHQARIRELEEELEGSRARVKELEQARELAP